MRFSIILVIWDKIVTAFQYDVDEDTTIIERNSGQGGASVDSWLLSTSRKAVGYVSSKATSSMVEKAAIKAIIEPGDLAVAVILCERNFNERRAGNIVR